MIRRVALGLLTLSLAAGLGACGNGTDNAVGPPPALPVDAVPTAMTTGPNITVHPNTSAEVIKAFKVAGTHSLAKEGRVWELRLGSQLVGVLQLTTLTERLDTAKEADRQSVRQEILAGPETEFDVATTPVWTAKDAGRGTYIWFGRQIMGILQLKSTQFESDDAATELVTTLLESPKWPELPPEAFEEDE